jgi:hypothetical protein
VVRGAAPLSDLAFRRLCRRFWQLGPRATEELMFELAGTRMLRRPLEERLSAYCDQLDRDTLDALAPTHHCASQFISSARPGREAQDTPQRQTPALVAASAGSEIEIQGKLNSRVQGENPCKP